MFQRSLRISGHNGPIYAASLSKSFLYTSSGDRFVTRWNYTTGEQDSSFTVKLDSPAYCIHTTDTTCFIGCVDGTLYAICLLSKTVLWEVNFFGNAWFSLAFVEQKDWLLAGDAEGNLVVVHAQTGERVLFLPLAAGKIRHLSLVRDEVFVCTQLVGILVFSLETWNELRAWEPNELGSNILLWDDDHRWYISAGKDAHIVLSDENHQIIRKIPAHYQTIYSIIRMGANWITCSLDKSIKVWSNDFSEVLQKIESKSEGHMRSVNALVKINEEQFASVSDDKLIHIWKCNLLNQV